MADRVETIGIYSAYGFAKEAGYTGTKAEFEQGLKNSAEYADNAASSANAATNAKNAAVTAKTDAQAAQSAAETAQGLAEDARAAAEEAKNDAEAAAASLDVSTIARIDGYYIDLAAGTADQLMASQKVHNSDPYIFRTSGGTSDVGNREDLEIVGGSVVWNQLIQNGNFADVIDPWIMTSATASVDNNIATITTISTGGIFQNISPKINHVILASAVIQNVNVTTAMLRLNGGVDKQINTSITEWQTVSNVVKYNSVDSSTIYIRIASANQSLRVKSVNVFDLTAMFGSEIADYIYSLEQATAGAGVAWFRKYFPNDYYAYNPGELMSVSDLQSHDTVGFNLLPVAPVYSETTSILDKEKSVRVFPNRKYIFNFDSIGNATNWRMHLKFWDINGNIVGGSGNIPFSIYAGVPFWSSAVNSWVEGSDNTDKLKYYIFNRPGYVRFYFGNGNTSSSMEMQNAVFNLSWSGTRDGEYEPYVKHSYPLDPSLTLRGIPKLTADGDLTYDGDIYKPDGTVERRYGIVDLGTLTWNTSSSQLFFTDSLVNLVKHPVNGTIAGNILLMKYVTRDTDGMTGPSGSSPSGDKEIGVNMQGRIYVNDFFYSDAASFKAAMSGVYLVYELAEPTTEEAEPYTSPQIVDDWGTEEFVTTSLVPVGHNTYYPANLRDKLQHLPDLPDNDGYYMTQVDGTQMSLIRFRIPQAPAEDGEYVLKANVSGGTPTYTWEAVVETEGGEG